MKKEFGELMARSRRNKGITLRKLGELVGMVPSQLSEIETGRRLPPKQDKLTAIAHVLDVDLLALEEAARKEWIKKDKKLLAKLFDANHEGAWALCRYVEEAQPEELKTFLEEMKKRNPVDA